MTLQSKAYIIGAFLYLITACQSSHTHDTSSHPDSNSRESMGQTQASEINYDCNFCGMPTQDPDMAQWNGHLVDEKGERWFCSPRCLLFTVKDSSKAPPKLQKLELKDYYTTRTIRGQDAYFVVGSDVLGPMGHDFVPFSDRASAEEFLKEHQGDAIHPFADVNLELVKKVVQKK